MCLKQKSGTRLALVTQVLQFRQEQNTLAVANAVRQAPGQSIRWRIVG